MAKNTPDVVGSTDPIHRDLGGVRSTEGANN
jgi:hypothetical protein